jgi:three-Cys-motif partner protein
MAIRQQNIFWFILINLVFLTDKPQLMNQFGGDWIEEKMDVVVKYAKAYLTIMNKQPWAKTIYFDGFAGSGYIESDDGEDPKAGTALRILEIVEPRPFDLYYFVEKKASFAAKLEKHISKHPLEQRTYVVPEDCNRKLHDLAVYLKNEPTYRALVFIDPYGMTIDWSSIEALKGLGVDLWILVPTGIGVNRLLTNNGDIFDGWMDKLERFMGYSRRAIVDQFYKTKTTYDLFGQRSWVKKEKDAALLAGELYAKKLREVFAEVSTPFVIRNSQNSIMYHLMMAANNKTAIKIANEVIEPKNKLKWPNPKSSGRK